MPLLAMACGFLHDQHLGYCVSQRENMCYTYVGHYRLRNKERALIFMKNIVGVACFQHAIPCRGDVLAREYQSSISGIEITVIFPSLRQTGQEWCPLAVERPSGIQADGLGDWGDVYNWNAIHLDDSLQIGTWIKQVAFRCKVAEEDFDAAVEHMASAITGWRNQVEERFILMGKGTLDLLPAHSNYFENADNVTGLDLFLEDDYSKISFPGGINIEAVLRGDGCYATPDEMCAILSKVDTSKQLCPEYRMYLNAVIEQRRGQFRCAVMEATTAVELCITQKIRMRCDELGIDGAGLCDMYYRSLGDRFSLLKHLGISWATENPGKEITKPRNDLFHNRNLQPSGQECSLVLEAVRAYLDLYVLDTYE